MRLAVDALGGDNAPGEIVAGAVAAARRLPDDEILLVGPEAEIKPHLGSGAPPNVSVRRSGGPIGMEEEPAAALRSRPDAGVSVAAKMVRAGEADAFFSAGSTGATVAAALMRIGRMDGLSSSGEVGAWWAVETRVVDGERQPMRFEADVVAGSAKRVDLVGEGKWSDDLDHHALGQLRRVVARIPGTSESTRLALFSRRGFDARLRATAEAEGILLFDTADLYQPTRQALR